MFSISDTLNEIILDYPFIEEGLSKGIINYSAFAREVRPQIEKKLYKNIKEGAIVMALKRISEKLSQKKSKSPSFSFTDITVRSNLSEFTYINSESLPQNTQKLFATIANKKDTFCNLSEGIRETTFVVSSGITADLKQIFKDEKLVNTINNLSSITLLLPEDVVYLPGSYYQVLKKLAWENINVIEVLSTFTELTVIVESKDIDRAFSIMKKT